MLKGNKSLTEVPKIWLFSGNRTKNHEIYSDEKLDMLAKGILQKSHSALSRETGLEKVPFASIECSFILLSTKLTIDHYHQTYVQDVLLRECTQIYQLIKHENAHVYVCGDVRMAEDVQETFK